MHVAVMGRFAGKVCLQNHVFVYSAHPCPWVLEHLVGVTCVTVNTLLNCLHYIYHLFLIVEGKARLVHFRSDWRQPLCTPCGTVSGACWIWLHAMTVSF